MNIKLIATDLDGTLLTSPYGTSDENILQLKAAAQSGIRIIVATGRTFSEIPQQIKDISEIDFFITSNGSCIRKNNGDIVHSSYLSEDTVQAVFEFSENYKCFPDIYIDGNSYMQKSHAMEFASYTFDMFSIDEIASLCTLTDDIYKLFRSNPSKTEKMNLFFASAQEREKAEKNLRSVLSDVNITNSMSLNIEISDINASKGKALEYVCGNFVSDIKSSEIMALGDSNNDISMFDYAGYSVAMGNAPDSVKNYTDRVTGICSENGFAMALKNIIK